MGWGECEQWGGWSVSGGVGGVSAHGIILKT